jgi:6-phosphogluconolactonase (cycloisomerase 2 family)
VSAVRRGLRYSLGSLVLLAGVLVAPSAAAVPVAGRPVYVTNSGRSYDGTLGPHTVGTFVGRAGALEPLGAPVATGAGARGIVFAPDGRSAYVIALDENAVYAYRVGRRGELTALGSPVDTGGVSPFGIAMAPNGRTLYTANLASHDVSVFAIGADGGVSRLGEPVPTGELNPRNVALSPDGRLLFVSHGTPADTVPDALVVFPVGPDGALGPALPPVPAGAAGTGITVTPDGAFLYVACSATDDVYGFRITAGGELVPLPGSPYPAPKTPEGVAMAPDGRHLYVTSVATRPVLARDDQGVWTFAIGQDGALTAVGPRLHITDGPGVSVTPDGRHLDTAGFWSNQVSTFDIDPVSGQPSQVPDTTVGSGGNAPAFGALGMLPNQGPAAGFTVARGRFDATSSVDRDGSIARYDWDFGDGTVLPDGGPRPVHRYARPGTYRVSLVVTDNEGCSTTFVYTGRFATCTGTAAAHTARTIVIN